MIWEEEKEEVCYEKFDKEEEEEAGGEEDRGRKIPIDFDFFALLSTPKDYYKILEVDSDATEDTIRSNYIRLALKWHPDKRKEQDSDQDCSTSRFQEINEAYSVLMDPGKKQRYDEKTEMIYIYNQHFMEYFNRHKNLILTCNGLGIQHSIW